MTRTIGLILVGSLLLLRSASLAGEKAKPFEQTPNETKIFEMTNEERKKKDLPPLKLNPLLSKIGRAHSENMAKQMKFEHNLDDKTPFDRIRAAGYKYAVAGENIAFGEEDASLQLIMKTWMESNAHRDNILQTQYTEIGIGIARDKMGQAYYTQVFGKPLAK